MSRSFASPTTCRLARYISDRVVFLDRGKVYAEDRIENLLDRESEPVIDEFFGGEG